MHRWAGRLAGMACLVAGTVVPALAQERPWRLAVVSESGDIVTWLAHRGDSLVVERVAPVGIMPADVDGPHNVAVAPDGALWLAEDAANGGLFRVTPN